MAEDNMEISYDDHGDDDIDINIDIDQENQDDDYMIEDAHSEAGTHDDVMVDEDSTSFAMEDDDYMPDHAVEDLQPEVVEVSEVEMTRATDIDLTVDNPLPSSTLPEQEQVVQTQETVEISQPHDAEPDVQAESNTSDQPLLPVTAPGSLDDTAQEAPSSPKKALDSDVVNTGVAPLSPPKSVQHDLVDEKTDNSSIQPTPKQETTPRERTVIVQYGGTEYALVASSESDDPDSYFLKDSSVLTAPLSVLFVCLREVLGDEVSSQDELCLTIDDLGLETFETCLSNNNVTFAQLVDLHTSLCRNDGQSEMLPLYITLNPKPEFGRSFEKMVEDAKAGLGLNEIMEWHGEDGTELWGGSEHGVGDDTSGGDEEDYEEEDHFDDLQPAHEEPEAETEDHTVGHEEDQTAVANEESVQERAVTQNEETGQAATGDVQDLAGEEQQVKNQTPQDSAAAVAQKITATSTETAKIEEIKNNDQEDEGDLIDYEDDDYAPAMVQSKAASRRASNTAEDFSSPCLRPASCFCSTCNKRLLAEYEAINEKLDRSRRSSRSSSQTLEGSNEEASTKPAQEGKVTSDAKNNQAEQTTSDIANIAEPDENELDNEENREEVDQQENVQEAYEEANDAAHAQGEADQYTNEDYTNYEEEPSENQPVDEGNGEPEATTQADDAPEQPDEAVAPKDEDEISYEDDDEAPEANSLPAVGEDAKQFEDFGVASVLEDNEDEIDYDDDDRAEAHPEESETVASITQITTGKRPHDEPDALDLTGQDAKRARA